MLFFLGKVVVVTHCHCFAIWRSNYMYLEERPAQEMIQKTKRHCFIVYFMCFCCCCCMWCQKRCNTKKNLFFWWSFDSVWYSIVKSTWMQQITWNLVRIVQMTLTALWRLNDRNKCIITNTNFINYYRIVSADFCFFCYFCRNSCDRPGVWSAVGQWFEMHSLLLSKKQ